MPGWCGRTAHQLTEFQFYGFFTLLMFAAATLFVIFACFYKGRTYLQSQEPGIHGPPEMATELGMP